jgi:hypothetical protein
LSDGIGSGFGDRQASILRMFGWVQSIPDVENDGVAGTVE